MQTESPRANADILRPGPVIPNSPPPSRATREPRLRLSSAVGGDDEAGARDRRQAAASAASGKAPQDAQRRLRCVVVEDEAIIAIEIEDMLTDLGVEVIGVAMSAAEAVRMAEAERPDLLTMDIRLQGERDGISAAIEIFQRFNIRSIFVSAYVSDPGTRERAAAADPLGWLGKPVRQDLLAKLLPLKPPPDQV